MGDVDFAGPAASSVMADCIGLIALAPAMGASTSPMLTRPARIDLRIRICITCSSAFNVGTLARQCKLPCLALRYADGETNDHGSDQRQEEGDNASCGDVPDERAYQKDATRIEGEIGDAAQK